MTFYSALHYAAKAEKYASEASMHNLGNKLTNCITEIPQDIKLEFNNGTLTLKAGSRVYVPNGAGKFDEVEITKDLSTAFDNNNQKMVFVTPAKNAIHHCNVVNQQSSGASSTSTSSYNFWYDTTNNYVKFTNNSGSTWTSGYSLPICLVTKDSGIDQTFNGFGYIGSTVFALPNVKGLIPNGRNEDGSLRNEEVTLGKVATMNTFNNYNQAVNLYIDGSLGVYGFEGIFSQTTPPTRAGNNLWYNPETNYWKYTENGGSTWNPVRLTPVAGASTTTTITSFQPKLPFRAVDQNDFNKLDEEVVKTSGNQTIDGVKTFTGRQIVQSFASDSGGNGFKIQDSNNKGYVALYEYITSDGSHYARLLNNSYSKNAHIDIQTTSAGVSAINLQNADSVKARTPSATSNDTNIATTAWVRSNAVAYKKYSSSVAITTPTSTSNKYTCPSNGLLWGSLCFGDTYGYIWINGTQYQLGRGMGSYNNAHSLSLYLNKGDVIYFQNTSMGDWTKLYFLPTA